jgi:hypothetical protein
MFQKTGLVILSFLTVITPFKVAADTFPEPSNVPNFQVI